MDPNSISIIIPVHREYDTLLRVLPSIAKLEGNIVQIILSISSADDTDYSLLCDVDARIHVHYCDCKGRAAQLNQGVTLASGSILWFIHADVLPGSTSVADISEGIASGKDAGWFPYTFDHPSLVLKINAWVTALDGIHAGGGDQCQWITRKHFDQLGGYRIIPIMEDFDLVDRLRAARIAYHIGRSKATVSARKYRGNSYLKVNLVNLWTMITWKHQDLDKLARWYHRSLAQH